MLRAIEMLERAGTAEAVRCLERWRRAGRTPDRRSRRKRRPTCRSRGGQTAPMARSEQVIVVFRRDASEAARSQLAHAGAAHQNSEGCSGAAGRRTAASVLASSTAAPTRGRGHLRRRVGPQQFGECLASAAAGSSHRSYASGGRMAGIRAWTGRTRSFASVVRMQTAPDHSPWICCTCHSPAKVNSPPSRQREQVRLFLLALGQPLEEAVGRHQAAAGRERLLEHRLAGGRLGHRVDQRRAGLAGRPRRCREAPAQQHALAPACRLPDGQGRLRLRDVVARLPLRRVGRVEGIGHDLGRPGQGDRPHMTATSASVIHRRVGVLQPGRYGAGQDDHRHGRQRRR